MRIIGGKYKGKKLILPKGIGQNSFQDENQEIRPTTSRYKEDLFNILIHNYKSNVVGGNVLDLFAGSGALGLECISRGCTKVVFVDKSAKSLNLVKNNLRSIVSLEKALLLKADALHVKLIDLKIRFSLVLLDPPYDSNLIEKSLVNILQQDIFREDCLFVVESNKNIEIKKLSLLSSKHIGRNILKIYQLNLK